METEWLLAAKEEDQEAFLHLQEQYEPMLRRQVAWAVRASDANLLQDCRQEALVAFHRAIMTYSASQQQVTFGLYAKICVKNRLCSFLRKQNRQRAIEATARTQPPAESMLDAWERDAEYLDRLQSLRAQLSDFERAVLTRWLAGEKPAQIARSLCKTPKAVYNALSRIRGKRKGMS